MGLKCNKCEVVVSGLVPEIARQLGLFEDSSSTVLTQPEATSPREVSQAEKPLMQDMDALCRQYGWGMARLRATQSIIDTQVWQKR